MTALIRMKTTRPDAEMPAISRSNMGTEGDPSSFPSEVLVLPPSPAESHSGHLTKQEDSSIYDYFMK